MKFVPRRDLWLSIMVWLCIVALALAGLTPLFRAGAGIVGGMAIFLICYTVAAILAWLWIATYCELRSSDLLVRSGPIVQTVPYASITAVKPIRSWVASTATSSRRVEIHYGRYEMVHVSPLDQERFLAELKRRCHGARFD